MSDPTVEVKKQVPETYGTSPETAGENIWSMMAGAQGGYAAQQSAVSPDAGGYESQRQAVSPDAGGYESQRQAVSPGISGVELAEAGEGNAVTGDGGSVLDAFGHGWQAGGEKKPEGGSTGGDAGKQKRTPLTVTEKPTINRSGQQALSVVPDGKKEQARARLMASATPLTLREARKDHGLSAEKVMQIAHERINSTALHVVLKERLPPTIIFAKTNDDYYKEALAYEQRETKADPEMKARAAKMTPAQIKADNEGAARDTVSKSAGFYDDRQGIVIVNEGQARMRTVIHELIHHYSAIGSAAYLSDNEDLNEGITEYWTKYVCLKNEIHWSAKYPQQLDFIEFLLNNSSVEEGNLAAYYFYGLEGELENLLGSKVYRSMYVALQGRSYPAAKRIVNVK